MRGWLLLALLVSGCTPGAAPANGASGSAQTTIDVNLTLHGLMASDAGTSAGYAPAVTTVTLGSTLRFINTDSFAHTATAISGATTFPSASPFGTAAQTASGSALSQGWSSGTLNAGASSQTFVADQRGTYIYGCFFHYGSPMRAEIIVR